MADFITDEQFRQSQTDMLSDVLQELIGMGPDTAQRALAETIKGWYDYHYQEMQKWKLLEEMIKSTPSWTGSMETK